MKFIITLALSTGVSLAADPKPVVPFKVDPKAPLKSEVKIIETEKEFTKYRIEFNGIEGDRRRDGEWPCAAFLSTNLPQLGVASLDQGRILDSPFHHTTDYHENYSLPFAHLHSSSHAAVEFRRGLG